MCKYYAFKADCLNNLQNGYCKYQHDCVTRKAYEMLRTGSTQETVNVDLEAVAGLSLVRKKMLKYYPKVLSTQDLEEIKICKENQKNKKKSKDKMKKSIEDMLKMGST